MSAATRKVQVAHLRRRLAKHGARSDRSTQSMRAPRVHGSPDTTLSKRMARNGGQEEVRRS